MVVRAGRRIAPVLLALCWLVCFVPAAAAPAAAAPAAGAPAAGAPAAGAAAGRYRPPTAPLVVVRAFDRGVTQYAAGHRGADLAAARGSAVASAARGVVSFAGAVAGRGVVVVTHPDGIRTTYEPVRPAVVAGQRVAAGQTVGTVDGKHAGCTRSCLHWGARRGDAYLDPLALLRPLGPVRLLPWT